ncbi:sensor histidine kinase [Cellulosilyticum sp. I15G10I2]|uniref:sensor histidine kinase n=1 Tax=Cellulosilyticum sp. I15G10I2 TaxID=1892843 RepID=UPI00085C4755|nr:sensor histidine kinase [Cellulosilyticum sp. I15G10I2]
MRKKIDRIRPKSIKQRLRSSYFIIIVMLISPCIFSWIFLNVLTNKYNRLITNIEEANRLNIIVKSDIPSEMWSIVVGHKLFDESNQYVMIGRIDHALSNLVNRTNDKKGKQLIEVAQRAMMTLTAYVDKIGVQINTQERVAESEKTLEEIRGVSVLVSEVLQEFIRVEIEDIGRVNQSIQRITLVSTLLVATICALVIGFAVIGFKSVNYKIGFPILKLEYMARQIAEGDLSVRAEEPEVEELKDLTHSLNIMAERIKVLIDCSIEEQRKVQKAEMKALQAQITPHFLYNTFDTIVWFAEQKRHQEVIRITLAFTNFFRISLSKGKDWITTAQEIEHVRNYLIIQSIRYGDILDYSIEIDPHLNDVPMLKLLLQPLVENAIYHGIKNKRGLGFIHIKGWQEGKWSCFCVEDNGIGILPEKLESLREMLRQDDVLPDMGFGIYNVHRRIRLYYEGTVGLWINSEYGEGTQITFKLPITKGDRHV